MGVSREKLFPVNTCRIPLAPSRYSVGGEVTGENSPDKTSLKCRCTTVYGGAKWGMKQKEIRGKC